MGDVVLTELLKERGLLPKSTPALDAFCLIEDETLRAESLAFIHALREAGCGVDYVLTPAKSDKQFKRALDSHAVHTVRLDRDSLGKLVARVKHLSTRQEKIVPPIEVPALLRQGQA
jgi:histidyl-tRNA synthetase